MRVLLQRVGHACVEVDAAVVGEIGLGLLVFVGVGQGDREEQAEALADKVVNLRVFPDETGKTNLSLLDMEGEALVISQFTLFADCRRGRRPSFSEAAEPAAAENLVDIFRESVEHAGIRTAAGRFGAHMKVTLDNDGPFTIMLDSDDLAVARRKAKGHSRAES